MPASRPLSEGNGNGLHVRLPDLPEALTGGDDLADTTAQAADCLAEAIAGRIARGELSETVVRRMLNPKRDTRPREDSPLALGKRMVVSFTARRRTARSCHRPHDGNIGL